VCLRAYLRTPLPRWGVSPCIFVAVVAAAWRVAEHICIRRWLGVVCHRAYLHTYPPHCQLPHAVQSAVTAAAAPATNAATRLCAVKTSAHHLFYTPPHGSAALRHAHLHATPRRGVLSKCGFTLCTAIIGYTDMVFDTSFHSGGEKKRASAGRQL